MAQLMHLGFTRSRHNKISAITNDPILRHRIELDGRSVAAPIGCDRSGRQCCIPTASALRLAWVVEASDAPYPTVLVCLRIAWNSHDARGTPPIEIARFAVRYVAAGAVASKCDTLASHERSTLASLLPLAINTRTTDMFGGIALATVGGTIAGTLGAMLVMPALMSLIARVGGSVGAGQDADRD